MHMVHGEEHSLPKAMMWYQLTGCMRMTATFSNAVLLSKSRRASLLPSNRMDSGKFSSFSVRFLLYTEQCHHLDRLQQSRPQAEPLFVWVDGHAPHSLYSITSDLEGNKQMLWSKQKMGQQSGRRDLGKQDKKMQIRREKEKERIRAHKHERGGMGKMKWWMLIESSQLL